MHENPWFLRRRHWVRMPLLILLIRHCLIVIIIIIIISVVIVKISPFLCYHYQIRFPILILLRLRRFLSRIRPC
jgi:hypothetical protein